MSIDNRLSRILFSIKTHAIFVNTISEQLTKNIAEIKKLLPSEDILSYSFKTEDGVSCVIFYADGVVNKQLLGDLIARPLSRLSFQKEGGMYTTKEDFIQKSLLFPELKTTKNFSNATKEILDGNSLLLVDGVCVGFIVGAKLIPCRSVIEPPTDVAVKGPREGFIEDIKTNMSLIRKRLKNPALRFEMLRVGKQSDTMVALCWLEGTSNAAALEEIKKSIEKISIDNIPDSSYIAALLSPRKRSLFPECESPFYPIFRSFCPRCCQQSLQQQE